MVKILLIAASLFFHPVHVSLMSAEYSTEKKVFSVFVKVYYDDFLRDLKTIDNYKTVTILAGNEDSAKVQIAGYLKVRVQMFAGGSLLPQEISKFTLEDNELKIYLECRMKKKPEEIIIRNTILTDIYKDQTNLVILNYGSFEEGVKLTPENKEYRFKVK